MTDVRRWPAPGAALPALAPRVAAAALVALAASTVLTTLCHVARAHSAIPRADEWFSLAPCDRILRGGDVLRLLFSPYQNETFVWAFRCDPSASSPAGRCAARSSPSG